MPNVVCLKESEPEEKRCALLPSNVAAYRQAGMDVWVESGLGLDLYINDEAYLLAGAQIGKSRSELLEKGDVFLFVRTPNADDLPQLQSKRIISFLDPFTKRDYVAQLCKCRITSLSMEMIPRISRSQKMDALSSQASLAGYVMVMEAMARFHRVFPMMMTPAGTLPPAKVFVLGAGVAGLQAIATAKRMGAVVTAFDTRTVVAEQVESLGAKFLRIELGQTGETSQGYAEALTQEQMAMQKAQQEACIIGSDIVITTAQLFGRPPPMLIEEATIKKMKPGSVVVDMAAENGGNVQGTVAGETIEKYGVIIIGNGNWPNRVALDAAQMYANNVSHLVMELWDRNQSNWCLDRENDIVSGALITHEGEVKNRQIRAFYQSQDEGA